MEAIRDEVEADAAHTYHEQIRRQILEEEVAKIKGQLRKQVKAELREEIQKEEATKIQEEYRRNTGGIQEETWTVRKDV